MLIDLRSNRSLANTWRNESPESCAADKVLLSAYVLVCRCIDFGITTAPQSGLEVNPRAAWSMWCVDRRRSLIHSAYCTGRRRLLWPAVDKRCGPTQGKPSVVVHERTDVIRRSSPLAWATSKGDREVGRHARAVHPTQLAPRWRSGLALNEVGRASATSIRTG